MKLLLYAVLLLLITPLFLVGLIFYMGPILFSRGKVSGTAYEPFNARLLYHLVGNRPDPAALQLAGGLPATNRVVMGLMIKPMAWASRFSGFIPSLFQYPPATPTPMTALIGARCEFLDQALLDGVAETNQVVILGAGWDTRAYGLLENMEIPIFEVDAPATQAVKLSALHKTAIDASHVTFVSCDFNRQSWLDALREHGFDQSQRTFILWEGTTMYLEAQAIQSTLQAVSTLPAGSSIAFDFFGREWLNTLRGKMAGWGVSATYGEPFTFGFPIKPDFHEPLRRYLQENGLALERGRSLGDEGRLPYGGLALAVNPGS
ncbi:MAG: SAM-dependent methyltransferase [Proteobacteria bacterium]|nr:SAM-dependent methyltransferase [Pseudomonadota bacterium]